MAQQQLLGIVTCMWIMNLAVSQDLKLTISGKSTNVNMIAFHFESVLGQAQHSLHVMFNPHIPYPRLKCLPPKNY